MAEKEALNADYSCHRVHTRIRSGFHDGLRVNYIFDRREFPPMTAFFEHSRSFEDLVLCCAVKNIIR